MRERRAYISLVVISALLALGSVLFSVSEQKTTEHKFCQLMLAFAKYPVLKPAHPKADQSREQNYEDYTDIVNLGHALGCSGIPVSK